VDRGTGAARNGRWPGRPADQNCREYYTSINAKSTSFGDLVGKNCLSMYRSLLRARTTRHVLSTTLSCRASGMIAAHATPPPFDWRDPLNSARLFTDDELAIAETAEAYCQERMLPRILRKWRLTSGQRFASGLTADNFRGLPGRKLRCQDPRVDGRAGPLRLHH
jgi:hypothetical protein